MRATRTVGWASLAMAAVLAVSSTAQAACDAEEFFPGNVEECDGPVIVVVRVYPGESCGGDESACSDRVAVVGVMATSDSSLCNGDEEACNRNVLMVMAWVGDDNEVCAAGAQVVGDRDPEATVP